MTAESNKIENGCFFFNKQKKCIISVCAKKQRREAGTKHCILGRAHGGQFPHPGDFAFASRKARQGN